MIGGAQDERTQQAYALELARDVAAKDGASGDLTGEELEGRLNEALKAARALHRQGVANVVVTLGSEGAVAVTPEGDYRVRPPRVDVVSAVGAGDAFTSGLIDADAEIRKVASAGWRKATVVPDEVIPVLVAALRDPANSVWLSVVSVWEVVIKAQLGKLALRLPLSAVVARQQVGIECTGCIGLPRPHR